MLTSNIVKGKDLMLFTTLDQYNGGSTLAPTTSGYADSKAYVAIAFATSHTKSSTLETSEITSKDHGMYGDNIGTKFTWQITSENLWTNYVDVVKTAHYAGNPIFVAWGEAIIQAVDSGTITTAPEGTSLPIDDANNVWLLDTSKSYEYGKALITQLDENASNGEQATFSITLTGCGPIQQVKH